MENMTLLDEQECDRKTILLAKIYACMFGIIWFSVFFSMVVPDIIESSKWSAYSCQGNYHNSSKYECCGLSCTSSSAESCSTYLGVCSSNIVNYNISSNPPAYNLILTYQCITNDFPCIEKKIHRQFWLLYA